MPNSTDEPVLTRGHKKKARTRRLLVDTALEVLAEQGAGFSVSDIATRAGVSHGTFYNYFADREQLIGAIVPEVLAAFATESAREIDVDDPAVRFAVITSRALRAVAAAPELVAVGLRLDAVRDGLLGGEQFEHLRHDVAEGHRRGRFTAPADDATIDVVVGALLAAARRIVTDEPGPAYRTAVVQRLLGVLGVDEAEAAALAVSADVHTEV